MAFIIQKRSLNSATILLETINKFSMGQDTKLTFTNQGAFLHTTNKHTEKEAMGKFPFTITSKEKKMSRISLTKELKNIYNENF